MADKPRYRFAPSPTGLFHVGGARTALFNWALARRHGGTFVLRIEDTDAERNRPEWTTGIIDALAWLGIASTDPHFEGPLFQSANSAQHIAAAERLYTSGHAYYCDMTAADIEQRAKREGGSGYGGWSRDRGVGPAAGHVLRFKVPPGMTVVEDQIRGRVEFDNAVIEDFVLLRSDGSPVFNLANVVDDIEMNITNVVRGEEHLSNTPKQQMLWEALGRTPPVWAHVPVMVNEQRKKLSKRRDKVALEQFRDEGYLADAMANYLMTLGWSPGDEEIQPWSALEGKFALADVNLSPAFFDLKKLAAFNGDYIRRLSIDELVEAVAPWLPTDFGPQELNKFVAMAPHIQPRLVTLADAFAVVDFMFVDEISYDADSWSKTMTTEYACPLLNATLGAYERLADENNFTAAATKAALEETMVSYELKLGKAQAPVRVAVTGRTVGPPLFETLEVMGAVEVLRRLRSCLQRMGA